MSALVLLAVMVAGLILACAAIWGCAVLNEWFEDRVSRHAAERRRTRQGSAAPRDHTQGELTRP